MRNGNRVTLHMPINDRVTRLESSLEGLMADVGQMRGDVREIKNTMSNLSRTNWPILIGAAGLALTIAGGIATVMGVVGSLAYNSVTQRIEMQVDNGRRTIDGMQKQIDKLEIEHARSCCFLPSSGRRRGRHGMHPVHHRNCPWRARLPWRGIVSPPPAAPAPRPLALRSPCA